MPPEWYANAAEGDERDVGGTKWYVKEVNGPVIWWARTRYGKAEACSQKQGPQGGFNSYGGTPHPYAYNPYASPMGQAYQKAQQGVKAEQKPIWRPVCFDAASEELARTPRNPIRSDRDFVTGGLEIGDFMVTGDVEHTFCAPGHEMKMPTVEELVETVEDFHKKFPMVHDGPYDPSRIGFSPYSKSLQIAAAEAEDMLGLELGKRIAAYYDRKTVELIQAMLREYTGVFSESCACGDHELSGCSPASAGPSSGEQPENDH